MRKLQGAQLSITKSLLAPMTTPPEKSPPGLMARTDTSCTAKADTSACRSCCYCCYRLLLDFQRETCILTTTQGQKENQETKTAHHSFRGIWPIWPPGPRGTNPQSPLRCCLAIHCTSAAEPRQRLPSHPRLQYREGLLLRDRCYCRGGKTMTTLDEECSGRRAANDPFLESAPCC